MMSYMMGGHGWGGMGFGFLSMLLFWLLIILAIVALLRWLRSESSSDQRANSKTPLDIIQERYARGEIDKQEYEEKKRDLRE